MRADPKKWEFNAKGGRWSKNLEMKGGEKKRMWVAVGKKKKRENSSGKRASSTEQWERRAVLIRVAKWDVTICLLLFFIRT